MVWHDYGFHPDQVRFEVMAAILDGAGAERSHKVYQVAYKGARGILQNKDLPVYPWESGSRKEKK